VDVAVVVDGRGAVGVPAAVGQAAGVLRQRVDDAVAVGEAGNGAVGVVRDADGAYSCAFSFSLIFCANHRPFHALITLYAMAATKMVVSSAQYRMVSTSEGISNTYIAPIPSNEATRISSSHRSSGVPKKSSC